MKERDLALAKVDEDFHAAAARKEAARAQDAPAPPLPDDAQGKNANKIQRNKRLTREEAHMNNGCSDCARPDLCVCFGSLQH